MRPQRVLLFATLVSVLSACESSDRVPGARTEKTATSARAGAQPYGAPLAPAEPIALAAVLKEPERYQNQTVTVEGKVRRNCTAKGCWMELAEGLEKSLPGCRVTFKDYGFFVPTNSAGSTAKVQGVVHSKLVGTSEVEHLEREGAVFPNKLPDGRAREVRLVATGVELQR
jgi:hypothetical protein